MALLLVAHGVKGGPGIAAEHATAMRRLGEFDEIAVACLRGDPGFRTALRSLRSSEVIVLPLLMAKGYSYEALLQDQLRASSARCRVTLCPPLGVASALSVIASEMAIETCRQRGWSADEVTVLVVGHGTRQSIQSRTSAISLADQVRRRIIFGDVAVAFLEDQPQVADVLAETAGRRCVVIGFFADRGMHGETDLALLTSQRNVEFAYAGPVGADPRIGALIADMAISARRTLSHFPERRPIVA